MLGEILNTLEAHQGETLNIDPEEKEMLTTFVQLFSETFARTFARTTAITNKTRTQQKKLFTAFQEILIAIRTLNEVNAATLAERLGVSERTIKTYLKLMTEAGMIASTGSTNNRKWHIAIGE